MITFCCLLPDGTIEERTRIGLSATVAEVPDAIAVWRRGDAVVQRAPAPRGVASNIEALARYMCQRAGCHPDALGLLGRPSTVECPAGTMTLVNPHWLQPAWIGWIEQARIALDFLADGRAVTPITPGDPA